MEDIFLERMPAHQKHGYGNLKIGEITRIDCKGKNLVRLRAAISSYSNYYNKQFQTRTKDGFLYVKRIK